MGQPVEQLRATLALFLVTSVSNTSRPKSGARDLRLDDIGRLRHGSSGVCAVGRLFLVLVVGSEVTSPQRWVMPSLYEFVGGEEPLHRLEAAFYSSVLEDPYCSRSSATASLSMSTT